MGVPGGIYGLEGIRVAVLACLIWVCTRVV